MQIHEQHVTYLASLAYIIGLLLVILSPTQTILVSTHWTRGALTGDSYYWIMTGAYLFLILGIELALGGVVVFMIQGARDYYDIGCVLFLAIIFSWLFQWLLVPRGYIPAGHDLNMFSLAGIISVILVCAGIYARSHEILKS